MKFLSVAFGMTLALLASQQALACRGSQWETATLLHKLPPKIDNVPVVARVAIVEVLPPRFPPRGSDWKSSERVKVRVIEAVKGAEEGQIFTLFSGGLSCDQRFSRSVNDLQSQGYIAGQLAEREGELVFTGQWNEKGEFRTRAVGPHLPLMQG